MKFEISCRECGAINRNELPIPSNNNGLDLSCYNCDSLLITFYTDESIMGQAITEVIKNISKVVEN